MKILNQNIKIPACSKDTIARADDVFTGFIDSDFTNWGTDVKSPKTEETELAVLEMDKNGTFEDIFGSISKDTASMCLTQAQIIAFMKEHKDKLRTDGYGTFFLFKVNGVIFVAGVFLGSGERPYADVDRFSYGYVWCAGYRRRIVVLQSALKGDTKARVYDLTKEVWRKMKSRCDNPNQSNYHNYGGRGISYCAKWETYEGFLDDMGEKLDGLSLDRIDNNGNYCKENCRWATTKEQASNRRDTISFNGETAKDASIRLGGGENLVAQRINDLEWDIERAFTEPLALKNFDAAKRLSETLSSLPAELTINGVVYIKK